MAIDTLSPVAKEGSTYVLTVEFTDEDGAAVTPTAATWSLEDSAGAEVNGRTNVPITGLASSVDIVLNADDLTAGGHILEELLVTVDATYNSGLGTGLKSVKQYKLPVERRE